MPGGPGRRGIAAREYFHKGRIVCLRSSHVYTHCENGVREVGGVLQLATCHENDVWAHSLFPYGVIHDRGGPFSFNNIRGKQCMHAVPAHRRPLIDTEGVTSGGGPNRRWLPCSRPLVHLSATTIVSLSSARTHFLHAQTFIRKMFMHPITEDPFISSTLPSSLSFTHKVTIHQKNYLFVAAAPRRNS